jgi:hypothetical protein
MIPPAGSLTVSSGNLRIIKPDPITAKQVSISPLPFCGDQKDSAVLFWFSLLVPPEMVSHSLVVRVGTVQYLCGRAFAAKYEEAARPVHAWYGRRRI